MAPRIPQPTIEQYEQLPDHLIHAVLDRWAGERPGEVAIVNASRGSSLTWGKLQKGSLAVAAGLARMGFRKGDVLAASLPLTSEHILLEYACFRLGLIHAPLDLRLQPAELMRCLSMLRARGYAVPGKFANADFGALAEAARQQCDSIEYLFQFDSDGERLRGATGFADLVDRGEQGGAFAARPLSENDPAQVIFTTGSTGSAKPAVLSHRSITSQNFCLAQGFHFAGQRVLCNLPPSHVGGQSELLLSALFAGATAVVLEVFEPAKSLDAIERHRVTLVGQIPAMFHLEWRTAGYDRRDFSSLGLAVYGGQAASRAFLDQMRGMAPRIATGLGLTEASGFCTYTACTPDAAEVERSVGWAMPVYPMSIREPMKADGSAGGVLPDGAIGHVCFRGPQTFLGYLNDPDATAAAISTDGWLYTGDLGSAGEFGLHLSGRAKWVLKPAGYQVFPGDIEAHFSALADQVANIGVVGHPHRVWGEGVVAFVEKRPGAELTDAELRRHARSLTSHMRPLHYVILESGAMPLNRTAKVDVPRLQEMAKAEVVKLRERGRWDS